MLSPELASFLYTFLNFFHSPRPPKLSTSLHINHKRALKVVFNYVLCLLFELGFCSLSCGILSLSATTSTFRSRFFKVYIVGVFRLEPHGQVGNDVDMDQVLLAQSDSSKEVVVNGGQVVVKQKSPMATRPCVQAHERFSWPFLDFWSHADTCRLPTM